MKTQTILRKCISIFLLSLLVISFTNCKKDKDISPENEIIGDWKLTEVYYKDKGEEEVGETLTSCMKSVVYTFNDDEEIRATYKNGCSDEDNFFNEDAVYFVDDNTVTLDGYITFDLSFSGNKMTWELIDDDGFGIRMVFTRK